jgi:hypothetical protein
MAIFTKRADPSAAAVEEPRSPRVKMNTEAEVRARAFDHLTAETAAKAHMSLDELRGFVSRQYFPSEEQLALLAQAMDAPVSALVVIRQAMAARISGRPPDWGPSRLNRTPDRGVKQGEENPSSAAHASAVRAFVDGKDDALTLDALNEFVRAHWGPGSIYDPATDTLRKMDIATVQGPGPEPVKGRPLEEILGPNVERAGLGWRPSRGPVTVRDAAPPKAAAPKLSPGWA